MYHAFKDNGVTVKFIAIPGGWTRTHRSRAQFRPRPRLARLARAIFEIVSPIRVWELLRQHGGSATIRRRHDPTSQPQGCLGFLDSSSIGMDHAEIVGADGRELRATCDLADRPDAGRGGLQPLVNDRALSKRERGRSRSPHREPIGLPPRAPVDRTLLEREGNDPAASPCLKATDYARSPRKSRGAPQVAVCAEHPSSPELAAEHTHGDSEVESMRCYREIMLDRCPAQSVRRCNLRQRRQARRPS